MDYVTVYKFSFTLNRSNKENRIPVIARLHVFAASLAQQLFLNKVSLAKKGVPLYSILPVPYVVHLLSRRIINRKNIASRAKRPERCNQWIASNALAALDCVGRTVIR